MRSLELIRKVSWRWEIKRNGGLWSLASTKAAETFGENCALTLYTLDLSARKESKLNSTSRATGEVACMAHAQPAFAITSTTEFGCPCEQLEEPG